MTDLETRISLVEQKYQQLEKRMDSIELKLEQFRADFVAGQERMLKTIYFTSVSTTGLILTAIGILHSIN